jgi:membrane protein required for colicin V production
MNGLDFVVIGILLLSWLLGFWRGLIQEVMSLVGWPLAFVLSKLFAGHIAPLLPLEQESSRIAAAYVLVFLVVLIVWNVIARLLSKLLKVIGSGWLDRTMGGVFGLVRGVLVVLILVWLAGLTNFSGESFWRNAMLSRTLEDAALLTKAWLPPNIAHRIHYGIRS